MSLATLVAFVDADEDWQDIFFLVAVILALLAAWLHYPAKAVPGVLLSLAVAAVAAGLLFIA